MSGYHSVVWEDARDIAGRNLPWEQLKDSTVLITGASGFIAAYMVYTLLCRNDLFNDNIRILALVHTKEKAFARFSDILDRSDFKIISGDVCNSFVSELKADFIIHAASPASVMAYSKDPLGTLNANIIGTKNILETAKGCNSKGVVFISSGMVYGRFGSNEPIDECSFEPSDSTDCLNVYCEAKRAGEMYCACYHKQYGIPVKIVRLFGIYGPGEHIVSGRASVCFANDVYNGRDIILKSAGESIRSFCYVADAAAAVFTVLLKGDAGCAYNVGSDIDVLSIYELAQYYVAAAKDKKLNVILSEGQSSSKDNIDSFMPDLTKLYSLGWKQHINIKDGIQRVLDSFI